MSVDRDRGSPRLQAAPEASARIEWVPAQTLRCNPRNARAHSKKQIRQIAESIRKFGFLNPLIVDDAGLVLAGHGRIEAARLIGMAMVPVLRFAHLGPTQKRAYVLADNRIAEQAGWDRELLALELDELADLLPAEGLDVTLTGFDAAEVDLLLADMAERCSDPDDAAPPLLRYATARLGDTWALGKHRLACGDARNRADVSRLMDGVAVAAAFTDPPYNLRVAAIGGRGRIRHPEFAFASGEMTSEQFRQFLAETLVNGVRASVPGAVHYVCMDWRHVDALIEVGRELYGEMLNLVVWNKTTPGQGSFYRSQHELICHKCPIAAWASFHPNE